MTRPSSVPTVPPRRLKKLLLGVFVLVSLFSTACSATASSSNVTQGGFAVDLASQIPAPDANDPFRVTFTNFELAMADLGFQTPGTCDGSDEARASYSEELTQALSTLRISGTEVMSSVQSRRRCSAGQWHY